MGRPQVRTMSERRKDSGRLWTVSSFLLLWLINVAGKEIGTIPPHACSLQMYQTSATFTLFDLPVVGTTCLYRLYYYSLGDYYHIAFRAIAWPGKGRAGRGEVGLDWHLTLEPLASEISNPLLD